MTAERSEASARLQEHAGKIPGEVLPTLAWNLPSSKAKVKMGMC
jgi:hypothetical protein